MWNLQTEDLTKENFNQIYKNRKLKAFILDNFYRELEKLLKKNDFFSFNFPFEVLSASFSFCFCFWFNAMFRTQHKKKIS